MTNFDRGVSHAPDGDPGGRRWGRLHRGGPAHVAARLRDYETNVAVVVAVLIIGWVGAALVVSRGMVQILAATLAMVGAYAVTRSIAATSCG